MTKKIKPAILFIMLICSLQCVCGQVQKNIPDYISQKFITYCKSVPREEIYIHSDREEYIAGEDLWFNIYLIDRQSLKTSMGSKIAYFELLNNENRPVVQKRIRIVEGFGPGQIVLPDTLSTGTYTIRAYTSWMKNFLPYNCFMKDIKIYNAFNTKTFRGKLKAGSIPKKSTTGISTGVSDTVLTLNVNNQKPDNIEILVSADANYRYQNNNLFYLFIQTHGIINHISSEKLVKGITTILLPKSLLIPGINQITLFDSKGWPICERFIFTPEKQSQVVKLYSGDSCAIRSKLTLELESVDALLNNSNLTNLSVSVTPRTNDQEVMDLTDYLVFGTEFGFQPSGTIKGRKINELPSEVMDSLLLTLKSNWITWGSVLSDNLPSFRFQVEKDGHYISGKLLNSDQKTAESNEFLIMSTPGKEAVFKYARTSNNGNFSFKVPVDEVLKDLIIQPDDVIKDHKINLESPFSDQYLKYETIVDSTRKFIPPYISKWSVNYQVKTIYGSSSRGNPIYFCTPVSKTKRFYGKPDIELIMADYIKLPVMQEVFFELLPGVFLKNKKSGYEISIADPVSNTIYDSPPGLLIDGVIINDPSIIANLDPELIEKIDVVNNKYFVGDYLFFGIFNVITKAGDFSCVTLPRYALSLHYRVTEPVLSFAAPDYSRSEAKNSRIPDFRNTLYWNPSVKPVENGKARIDFWTSDITSDYLINVQGITSDGRLVSLKKTFSVK